MLRIKLVLTPGQVSAGETGILGRQRGLGPVLAGWNHRVWVIWGYLNSSYNGHYRNCCPGPGKRRLSVVTGLGQGRFALQGVACSSPYYRPREASGENLALMQPMDRQYLETPFYGSRRMKVWLARQRRYVRRKLMQRLLRIMGLRAIYCSPRTSRPAPEHQVYPHLLEQIRVTRPNQAWATDITYLPMARWFLYLVAIMDWHSRYVVARRLSNTLEADFCVDALKEALGKGQPGAFNTDQGSHFTSLGFIQVLKEHGVKIRMDGKGRYNDKIFVERLWRTVKYEDVYLKVYANATEARRELGAYIRFYNDQGPHQAPGYRTQANVFHEARNPTGDRSKETEGPPEQVLASLAGAVELSLISAQALSNLRSPPQG